MSDKNIVTPNVDNLLRTAKSTAKRGPAPVHLWNPAFCGDLDMRIGRDGTWYYMGTPIGRKSMVELFSTILKREGDAYFLVTPVEKVGITVDDAPFVAIDFDVTGAGRDQVLHFTTNVGETVTADPDHPIRVEIDPKTGEPSPYILIRSNLEALIDRKSFYRLVELGETIEVDCADQFGLFSSGAFFPVISSSEI